MRVLVVESDHDLGPALKAALEERCFAVDLTPSGLKGYWLARTNDYDAMILSAESEDKPGKQVCADLRERGERRPIIILQVESGVAEKIETLECGADDCMVKPISADELAARIHAILRRPQTFTPDVLELDDLAVDIRGQTVLRAGKKVYLTRKEFQLLEYLLRNAHRPVSRGMILEHVWDQTADPFSNTIETHILNLRRKLDRGSRRKLIHTLPGRGYKIGLSVVFVVLFLNFILDVGDFLGFFGWIFA